MLGYALMKEGYQFEEATDAEEARHMISRRKPNLIFNWKVPLTISNR